MFLRVNHPRDGMVKQSLVIKNDNIPPISIAHGEREKKCAKSGAGPHTVRKWSPNHPRMEVLVKLALAKAGAWQLRLQPPMTASTLGAVLKSTRQSFAEPSLEAHGLRCLVAGYA